MKIIHLTVVREITSGQLKQLKSESVAASALNDLKWESIVYQSAPIKNPLVRRIPFLFRPLFLRNLFGWLVALTLSGRCDYLMLRHITFDPFAFVFSPLIRNRISVHHSKEIEELKLIAPGWRGELASKLEIMTGRAAARNAVMIAGVTREIAIYENILHNLFTPTITYPNGVNIAEIPVLSDGRAKDYFQIAFICGTFSAWHGLDRLIDAVERCQNAELLNKVKIHLIGSLNHKLKEHIKLSRKSSSVFVIHGHMNEAEYSEILRDCHAGVGSLAMYRQNLSEGATLKVREMLAMGLPVFSGHIDTALPSTFKFYYFLHEFTLEDIIAFCSSCLDYNRNEISASAEPYISKAIIMQDFAKQIRNSET